MLRIDGYRVVMFPNDHPPTRVQVFGSDGEALNWLNCPTGPPTLRDRYRLSESQTNKIRVQLTPHVPRLCEIWEEMHGKQ